MKRRISAVEARKHLGELLEGVYYRGDEVIIERAGKPMAVVIDAKRYARLEESRERILDVIEDIYEQTADKDAAELEAMINEAVAEVRAERRARARR